MAQGYSHILSPGRVPKGALGHGKETGPMVMLVPGQGALQPVGGRLSITVIISSWLQVHGALSWDSFQRPGNGGQGTAILGSPRHPSCHALCCPRRGGHASHEGPSALLPPITRGESHIPGMRQPRAGLTWVMLNPSRWRCASPTGATRAEGGAAASGPEAKV